MSRGEVAGHDNRVVAAGPVGFTAATEAPRLELIMGWPPSAMLAAGYLNFIASYGIVTNGMVSPIPCQTNIMAFSVNAGSAYSSPNTFADLVWNSHRSLLHLSRSGRRPQSPRVPGVLCVPVDESKVIVTVIDLYPR